MMSIHHKREIKIFKILCIPQKSKTIVYSFNAQVVANKKSTDIFKHIGPNLSDISNYGMRAEIWKYFGYFHLMIC